MNVIMSIKPEFANKILDGTKKFEFRTQVPQKEFKTVIIYATSPIKKMVGEFTVRRVIKETPEELWKVTQKYAGIDYEYFSKYFKGREYGYAIEVKNYLKYYAPIDPYSFVPNFNPPQSFMYLKSINVEGNYHQDILI